jgi:hypothetical protein
LFELRHPPLHILLLHRIGLDVSPLLPMSWGRK